MKSASRWIWTLIVFALHSECYQFQSGLLSAGRVLQPTILSRAIPPSSNPSEIQASHTTPGSDPRIQRNLTPRWTNTDVEESMLGASVLKPRADMPEPGAQALQSADIHNLVSSEDDSDDQRGYTSSGTASSMGSPERPPREYEISHKPSRIKLEVSRPTKTRMRTNLSGGRAYGTQSNTAYLEDNKAAQIAVKHSKLSQTSTIFASGKRNRISVDARRSAQGGRISVLKASSNPKSRPEIIDVPAGTKMTKSTMSTVLKGELTGKGVLKGTSTHTILDEHRSNNPYHNYG